MGKLQTPSPVLRDESRVHESHVGDFAPLEDELGTGPETLGRVDTPVLVHFRIPF